MPTSRPTGICRVNNLYQEPILEEYDCKEEEQCDSEHEGEDDGWPGIENHWCPLLDLSYHYFIGRSQVGFDGRDGLGEYIGNLSACYIYCSRGA